MVETPVDTRRDRPPEKKICFRFAKISPSATVQKLFSSTLFFSDFKISSQAQAVSQFPFTALLVVAISFFLVHCSFPISKFPRRRRPFLNFYLPPCWWSQKARVHCSFPISKFPRRRRPFLNFHTALLMIATGAHTQTKSTSGKKFAFASRKFSPSATVLKLFSSALFFSDFKFFGRAKLSLAKIFRFQIFPGLA